MPLPLPPTMLVFVVLASCVGFGAAKPAIAQGLPPIADACQRGADCLEQAQKSLTGPTRDATSELARAQDRFYWFGRINMASTVANVEAGIIPPSLAGPIARGVAHAIDQGNKPGGARPLDVLQTEKIITDVAGPEATLIHTGRSRQDMHSTLNMAQLRIELLDFTDQLDVLRKQLLDMAGAHVETFVPAYTNGVQAMPISLAHYLLAFADSFARDAERIRQAWPRIDRSPLGTAVLANSSWPLDRRRLADLLGFEALAVNGYDATQISPMDVGLEAAAIAQSVAVRVGMLMQDLHVQYHQTRPWLVLAPGRTYTSSAMPQKANPGIIMNTRALASDVIASVHAVVLRGHNVTPGMTDYKNTWSSGGARTFVLASRMLKDTADVLAAVHVDVRRAMDELEAEWTTSMELAEALQRDHRVPFRIGHHFASEIVVHARKHGLVPKVFPYADAVRIYAEAALKYKRDSTSLPLDESAFRRALAHDNMVRTRVGIGGPQPEEVRRMLSESRTALASDRSWVASRRRHLADAEAKLNETFNTLLKR